MTLDEAIQHAEEIANKGCDQCAKDHQQLADWLKELKELRKLGWHPASELPPLDENGNSQDLIVICGTTNLHYDLPRWSSVVNGIWGDKDVKRWCYPPEEYKVKP